jgi:hypothetical protein
LFSINLTAFFLFASSAVKLLLEFPGVHQNGVLLSLIGSRGYAVLAFAGALTISIGKASVD